MLDEKSLAKREQVLNKVEKLLDSFFEKYKLFETEKQLHPGSPQSQKLFSECEHLRNQSRELLDQL